MRRHRRPLARVAGRLLRSRESEDMVLASPPSWLASSSLSLPAKLVPGHMTPNLGQRELEALARQQPTRFMGVTFRTVHSAG